MKERIYFKKWELLTTWYFYDTKAWRSRSQGVMTRKTKSVKTILKLMQLGSMLRIPSVSSKYWIIYHSNPYRMHSIIWKEHRSLFNCPNVDSYEGNAMLSTLMMMMMMMIMMMTGKEIQWQNAGDEVNL